MTRVATLLYSHFFPPSVGGAESYAAMLADYLACVPDIDLTVATGTAPAGDIDRAYRVERQPSSLRLARLAMRSDVVVTIGLQPQMAIAARLGRVPYVWIHVSHDAICPKSMAYRWQDDTMRTYATVQCWQCLRVDHSRQRALRDLLSFHLRRWLFTGTVHVSMAEIVRRRLPVPRGTVIFNGCDTSVFRPMPEVPRDMNCVLFLARLIPEKGAHLLIEALARARAVTPDLHAVIYGDGPELDRLRDLARRNEVEAHVAFAGSIRRDDIPTAIAGSLAVVNPQLWDWTLGISAIETLACGRPLLSTRPVDPQEMPDDVALLFPRGDVEAIAQALVRIRTDAELRRQLEAAGPPFVKTSHSLDGIGVQYAALIRQVAASRSRLGFRRNPGPSRS